MIDFSAPIPSRPFPARDAALVPENTPFVKLENSSTITVEMQYIKQGIPGAVSSCYLRQPVYQRLVKAAEQLPRGFKFKIYDGWRPLAVQKALYRDCYDTIAANYKELDGAELQKVMDTFVFPPSEDVYAPPLHCTGGAVDLTILDDSGAELDMGTAFDDFTDRAHTAFFESSHPTQVAENRRLLYHTMLHAGFTNLPSEWWHFDYGTIFWGHFTKQPAKFIGVFSEDRLFFD